MKSSDKEGKGGQSWSNKGGAVSNKAEEFPSLPGASPASNPSVSAAYSRPTPTPKASKNQNQGIKASAKTDDFPGLPSSKKQQNFPSLPKDSGKPKNVEDFPGLSTKVR